MKKEIILSARNIVNRFGKQVVHDDANIEIYRGEIIGLVGGSGSGKSVMLRTMTGLHKPNEGVVEIAGKPLAEITPAEVGELFGILFQQGALFSSLTVAENIMLPLKEHTDLTKNQMEELAQLKISLVGLKPEAAIKYPSELSGGMIKRASLARALALDPLILFLDEPTSGLDPISAAEFDELIVQLNQSLGVTVVMITHDLDTLFGVCDRAAVLIDKQIIIDSLPGILKNNNAWIKEFFHGPRAHAAMLASKKDKDGK